MRPQPLRAANEEVLLHKWTANVVWVRCRATGAEITTPGSLNAPSLGQPVGAGEVDAAKVGSLRQVRSCFHVGIRHSDINVVPIVVTHIRERIDDDVSAGAGGRGGSALTLRVDAG